MKVIPFPTAPRDERDHLLRVARTATPLLEAAFNAGDARLIAMIFDALGAVARGDDARDALGCVRLGDADVVPLQKSR